MKIKYERSFYRDIEKIRDPKIKSKIVEIIVTIKNSTSITDISNVIKLKGHYSAFRIKIRNYRIGFFLESDVVIFSRCLDRKDIYKYFP